MIDVVKDNITEEQVFNSIKNNEFTIDDFLEYIEYIKSVSTQQGVLSEQYWNDIDNELNTKILKVLNQSVRYAPSRFNTFLIRGIMDNDPLHYISKEMRVKNILYNFSGVEASITDIYQSVIRCANDLYNNNLLPNYEMKETQDEQFEHAYNLIRSIPLTDINLELNYFF